MIIKVTSKRQVTFPKRVMEKLHLRAGDSLVLSETADGILIKPHRFDTAKLAPLRSKISANLPAPDFDEIRHASLQQHLRD